ncbi:MAG: choice-of-anchor D domain-containing protein [Bacteroidota bacterium]|nr:choice-of-anchor D domain-containing protein [Bacteroidota bacterium]
MRKIITLAISVICLVSVNGVFGQWSTDTKISISDTTAGLNENMGQCLAASGDSIHVVWSDRKTDSTAIYYRHSYDAGISWGPVIRIAGFSKSVDDPSVAVNGSTVHVTWRDNTATTPISYYCRSLDGGISWQTPVSLGNYFFWPNVTCSGATVFVGLNDSHPGNSEVYMRRSTDNGTTWDAPIQISNASGRSEDQSIAAGGGFAHLAWNDNRTGIMQSWYRRSTDNGVTWGAETQFTHTTGFAYFPIVHTSGIHVDFAWGDRGTGSIFDIFFSTSSDYGATWSAQQQLTHGSASSAYPTIARDGNNVHLAWGTFGGDMYYEHSGDGGISWDPLVSLAAAANKPTPPFIVVSGPMLHVIWIDRRDGHPEVYYKRNPTGNPHPIFEALTTIDFGDLKLAASADTTITLRNTGSAPLKILRYGLIDPENSFILLDTSVHGIAASDSITIRIRFTASTVGADSGTLTILTDEFSSIHSINLRGRGIDSKLDIPGSIDFGDLRTGLARDSVVQFHNRGLAAIQIFSYSLSDPFKGFTLLDTSKHVIAAQDSIAVSLRFSPVKAQGYSGSITFTTDESGLATHRILLSGRGMASKLRFNPSPLDLGTVDSGSRAVRTLLLINDGTAEAKIDSLPLTGSSAFVIDSAASPFVLVAGGSKMISITFAPPRSGQMTALLTAASIEGTLPQVLVEGNGKGKNDTIIHAGVQTRTSVIDRMEINPNPASNTALLTLELNEDLRDVKIEFYDAAGRLQLSQSFGSVERGTQTIPLVLPHQSGTSIVKISAEGKLFGTIGLAIIR